MKTILIVDDDVCIGDMLQEVLVKEGYQTARAYSGTEALLYLSGNRPDLILLDLMLPGLSGEELLPLIEGIPVIVVSARSETADKVELLLSGADDYITKPFSLQVVLLRVEAVLRRAGNPTASSQRKQYTWRALCLDPEARSVTLHGQRVALTQLEFDLLALLLAHPHQVFTRAHLLQSVWGYDFLGEEKAVNIHIMNLRRKLGREIIETVRGVGYRLGDET